jgi:hypothetical protein
MKLETYAQLFSCFSIKIVEPIEFFWWLHTPTLSKSFPLKVDENKWMKYEQDWKHIIGQVDVSYDKWLKKTSLILGLKAYGLGLFIGQKIWNAHVHYMSLTREKFYSLL